MTVEQIKYILHKKGFETDVDTTLDDGTSNSIGLIGLFGDNNIVAYPETTKLYFDTKASLLYVKRNNIITDIIAFSHICAFYDKLHSAYFYY